MSSQGQDDGAGAAHVRVIGRGEVYGIEDSADRPVRQRKLNVKYSANDDDLALSGQGAGEPLEESHVRWPCLHFMEVYKITLEPVQTEC